MDPTAIAKLPVEAMRLPGLPSSEKARSAPALDLERRQISTRPVALESQLRTGVCFAGAVLSELGATRAGGTMMGMNQLGAAVVRDSYAWWCGRSGAVTPRSFLIS